MIPIPCSLLEGKLGASRAVGRARPAAALEAGSGFRHRRRPLKGPGERPGPLVERQQLRRGDLEGLGEFLEGVDLGGRRVRETLEALDVPVG